MSTAVGSERKTEDIEKNVASNIQSLFAVKKYDIGKDRSQTVLMEPPK